MESSWRKKKKPSSLATARALASTGRIAWRSPKLEHNEHCTSAADAPRWPNKDSHPNHRELIISRTEVTSELKTNRGRILKTQWFGVQESTASRKGKEIAVKSIRVTKKKKRGWWWWLVLRLYIIKLIPFSMYFLTPRKVKLLFLLPVFTLSRISQSSAQSFID